MRRVASVLVGGLVTMLSGCPAPGPAPLPPSVEPFPHPPSASSLFMDPRIESPGVSPADAPPPISGGTLHLLQSSRAAVVADPDRDRILVVDLAARRVMGETTHLPPGAEPGRVAEDAAGRVHVVLRGTGELYSFDPEAVDSGERRAACAMPRGLAYDAASDQLHVACRGGELVTFAAAGGEALRTVQIERDLRDVVVQGSRLFVSRFRTAELVEIDAAGHAMGSRVPQTAFAFGRGFEGDGGMGSGFEPAVAWRTISAPAGDVAMVHQRASGQEVAPDPGGYGGGGSGCESSIVQSSLTFFHADGTVSNGPDLGRATLPVDVAISPVLDDGTQRVAVVAAGNERGDSAVLIWQKANLEWQAPGECATPEQQNNMPIPNATSAVYAQDGTLVVLSRDADDIEGRSGAHLALLGLDGSTSWIHLGGERRFDAGHAVFHGNSGAFLACASCHPEGGEDGRVWTFGRIGARRTPAMHGDLIGTEPFHWDGDMQNLEHLVRDVLTGRMQGPELDRLQVDALGGWLDELPAPTVGPTADRDAVARGAALYYGEAQCATCHSGALYSNNATVDVGTGGAFQVPSLIGVSYRTPVMHSGCATTLKDRFTEECGGGDMHGRTSHLAPTQIDDLVSFLDTL